MIIEDMNNLELLAQLHDDIMHPYSSTNVTEIKFDHSDTAIYLRITLKIRTNTATKITEETLRSFISEYHFLNKLLNIMKERLETEINDYKARIKKFFKGVTENDENKKN